MRALGLYKDSGAIIYVAIGLRFLGVVGLSAPSGFIRIFVDGFKV